MKYGYLVQRCACETDSIWMSVFIYKAQGSVFINNANFLEIMMFA